MRLAVSSTAFDRTLAIGDLTQLELIDMCARVPSLDGIVLDLAHFPRRDSDYIAQIKKLASDLMLPIVAVRDDALSERGSDALAVAAGVGAPYVLTRMPEAGVDPIHRYNGALGVLGPATAEAKRLNVTLAVRNVPGSLAADGFELSRLRKEADSAWLRFALDPLALEAAPDDKLRKHAVLAYHAVAAADEDGRQADDVLAALPGFRGFLCLDVRAGDATAESFRRFVEGWHACREGVAEPHVPS
jgi:sugar phosphate isomerase/epimerase